MDKQDTATTTRAVGEEDVSGSLHVLCAPVNPPYRCSGHYVINDVITGAL
jgi:hypothetical protein